MSREDLIGLQTEAYYARTLCLPLFPSMTYDDVDRVVETLKNILGLNGV